ncbi:hydrogenase nickel incorporation protein HypB [Archaeoglobus neptunius]|uniref:hydrogenase nickel incorporation protein HypB n=1 Tax=Archaeoglobus neptunius TaxID=2798580 RepID=UPI0019292B25|nr:hydrogenase nickel incorporation protein HypB [Archaeoglobus neptunius]
MHEYELKHDLMAENRKLAQKNRDLIRKNGMVAINLMGAIGSGKTLLIETTVRELGEEINIGAILGDVVSRADYERVRRLGVKAEAISTGKECHLDAHMIHHRIKNFSDVDLLLIENVGNLICPVDFDLGENFRVVMVSVTEGDDVVEKHPEIFRLADVVIINKVALAEAVGADVKKMRSDVRLINPRARLIEMDLKEGIGVDEWLRFVRDVVKNVSGNSGKN